MDLLVSVFSGLFPQSSSSGPRCLFARWRVAKALCVGLPLAEIPAHNCNGEMVNGRMRFPVTTRNSQKCGGRERPLVLTGAQLVRRQHEADVVATVCAPVLN
jgi:hypothetical protein